MGISTNIPIINLKVIEFAKFPKVSVKNLTHNNMEEIEIK